MIFEWRQSKNLSNQLRHGVSFDCAAAIFEDLCVVSMLDQRFLYNGERWLSFGLVRNKVVLVVHTIEGNQNGKEVIRIISSRKATRQEERRYYSYSCNKAAT